MDFRIGINVGDVLVDGDNLYGDGVNVAARLEGIAAPGSTCVSGSVFALVKNKLSYGFEDMGLQSVKNIPEPVSAYRLASSPPVRQETSKTSPFNGRWTLAFVFFVIVGAFAFFWSERRKEHMPPSASGPAVVEPANSGTTALSTAPPAPAERPSVPALSTKILRAEPAIGQLPTGATALVDDGTCPDGQIKQIVGGNVTTGQPRLRSCIPRPEGLSVDVPSNTPPRAVSAPPQLDTAALERIRPFVGNTVGGISTVTGKPFAMTLKAGGVAEVKVEFAGGGFSLDQGNWWIEPNGHFCVHYTRFAGGNSVCRELSVEKGIVKAYTWDHRPHPWVFSK